VVGAHALSLLEVGAGAERLVAGAGDDDDADLGVGDELFAEPADRDERVARERIANALAVQGQKADVAAALDDDGDFAVAHVSGSSRARPACARTAGRAPWASPRARRPPRAYGRRG